MVGFGTNSIHLNYTLVYLHKIVLTSVCNYYIKYSEREKIVFIVIILTLKKKILSIEDT